MAAVNLSPGAHVTLALAVFAPTRPLAGALLAGRKLNAILPWAVLPAEKEALASVAKASTGMAISLARHQDASPALLARLARRNLAGVDAAILTNVHTGQELFLSVLARPGRMSDASTVAAMGRCTLAEIAACAQPLHTWPGSEALWPGLLLGADDPAVVAWAFNSHFELGAAQLELILNARGPLFLTRVVQDMGVQAAQRLAHYGELSAQVLGVFLAALAARAGLEPHYRGAMPVMTPALASVVAGSYWAPHLVAAALRDDVAEVQPWMTRQVLATLLGSTVDGMYGKYALWAMYPQTPALPAPELSAGVPLRANGKLDTNRATDALVAGLGQDPWAEPDQVADLLVPLGRWGLEKYAAGRLGVPARMDVLMATVMRTHSSGNAGLHQLSRVLADVAQRCADGDVVAGALLDDGPTVVFYGCDELGRSVACAEHDDPPSASGLYPGWAAKYLASRVEQRFGADEVAWEAVAAFGPSLAASAGTVTEILDAVATTLADPGFTL